MSPLGAVPCDDSLNMQYFTRFLGKNMIWFFLVIDGFDFNRPGSKYCLLMTITNPLNGDMIILVLSLFIVSITLCG